MASKASLSVLMSLADLVAAGPEDHESAPGFVANLHGETVEVTAVLQRTAVVAPLRDRWADKQMVRHADLLVDPAAVVWRLRVVTTGFPMKRRRHTADQRKAMRAANDRRARAEQVRRAAAEAAARKTAAQRYLVPPTRPGTGATTARRPAARASCRASAVSTISSATPDVPQSEPGLAAELRRARQRIATLEAELESHRAVAREMLRRIEAVVGLRAA